MPGGGRRGLGYSWRGRGRFTANISADIRAEVKLIFYTKERIAFEFHCHQQN